jgi:WD40 repeat protein
MKKIMLAMFTMTLPLLTLTACVTMEPAHPPLIVVEKAHFFGSKKVAFSPSGKYLASSGLGGEIKIWSVPDLQLLQTFTRHRDTPWGMVWLDDANLASGDDDGLILLWCFKNKQVLLSQNTPSSVTALVFLPKQNMLFSGHADGRVRAFSPMDFKPLAEYDAGARVLSIAAAPAEDMIAVSSLYWQLMLLDTRLKPIRRLTSPPLNAIEIAFSPDGKQLASGNWFKLFFWDVSSDTLKVVKSDHYGVPFSMDYSPNGHFLATIGRHTDSEIYLVDPQNGKSLRHLKRHHLCGASVRFSPKGSYLASASDDGSVRLYDMTVPYAPRD